MNIHITLPPDKPDKISRKRMTQSYMEGGLNVIDMEAFISALKINWKKTFNGKF